MDFFRWIFLLWLLCAKSTHLGWRRPWDSSAWNWLRCGSVTNTATALVWTVMPLFSSRVDLLVTCSSRPTNQIPIAFSVISFPSGTFLNPWRNRQGQFFSLLEALVSFHQISVSYIQISVKTLSILLRSYKTKTQKFAFRPICCLHFGPVSKEKQRFWPLLGKWRRFEGNETSKNCTKFWCTFLAPIFTMLGANVSDQIPDLHLLDRRGSWHWHVNQKPPLGRIKPDTDTDT